MNHTVSPCLLSKRKKVNGMHPVFIRLTKNGQSVYIKLDITIPESAWNVKKKRIRDVHPQSRQYNQLLEEQLMYWNKSLASIANPEAMTIIEMKDYILSEKEGASLEQQENEYLEHLIRNRRVHELPKAETLFVNLKSYSEKHVRINEAGDIDARVGADFQLYLMGLGLCNNTIRRRMGSFTAFMEYMRLKGYIQANPVLEVKKVPEEPTRRVKLSDEQIDAIRRLSLDRGTKVWHARNYFMYSFYNGGIRFSDLCRLRWKDIRNDRLIYTMSKTGEEVSLKQGKPQMAILELYRGDSPAADDYIFPLLKGKVFKDGFEERRIISSLNVSTNDYLKKIATLAGIAERVTTHIARHSFADYGRRRNIDLHTMSKLLRHSKLATTERYLAGFDAVKADEAMDTLFGDVE